MPWRELQDGIDALSQIDGLPRLRIGVDLVDLLVRSGYGDFSLARGRLNGLAVELTDGTIHVSTAKNTISMNAMVYTWGSWRWNLRLGFSCLVSGILNLLPEQRCLPKILHV